MWTLASWVCLEAEGVENVSWPCLSPLRGGGLLTMALTGKFVDMVHYFVLLRINLFDLGVDTDGW